MFDINQLLNNETEKKLQNVSNIDYSDLFEKSKIDLQKKYDRPPLVISYGFSEYKGVMYPNRFATYGNISMIVGDKKSRKTFFKSLLLACAIGGNANLYHSEIKGHGLDKKWIIDIDTEQDTYDNWQTAKRIPEMVGTMPNNYIPINMRGRTPEEINQMLDWLFLESKYKDNLGIVCIDGYVDCINDFNNQIESKDFTTKLMNYSKLANCHITGVLHTNPNTEKARGHFGTILEQKCEIIVLVKKDGEFSEVICKAVRGAKDFETFYIGVSKTWLPYLAVGVESQNWKNQTK